MKKKEYIFCVIVKVPNNILYDDYIVKNGGKWVFSGEFPKRAINNKNYMPIKAHPFEIGELLILNKQTEREISYPQRKPAKWGSEWGWLKRYKIGLDVDYIVYRYFNDLDKAVHFCELVQSKKL